MCAVLKNTDIGKKIAKSKIIIVWHTTYSGDTLEGMTASYGVDQPLKRGASVWHTDAEFKDVSGSAKLTAAETTKVTVDLSEAGGTLRKINSKKMGEWNPSLLYTSDPSYDPLYLTLIGIRMT